MHLSSDELVRRGVEKLLALGRAEEAAQLADRVSDVRLTTDLAPLFEEAGCEEVFADLLVARTDEDTPHARVLKWLIPYHRRRDEPKQVLDDARSLYFRSPGRDGLRTYREAARMLDRWSEEKRRAIERLEREGEDRALLRLNLEEGEVGAAIEGLRELEEAGSNRAPNSRWESSRVPNSLREEAVRRLIDRDGRKRALRDELEKAGLITG